MRNWWKYFIIVVALLVIAGSVYLSPTENVQLTVLSIGIVVLLLCVLYIVHRATTTIDHLHSEVLATEKRLEDDVKSLGRKIGELKKLGVYRFSQRSDFDNDYWKTAITDVRDRSIPKSKLVLVGRTLEKWVEHPFSEIFKDAITKVLVSGGTVRMVTLDPAGEAGRIYSKHSGKDLALGAKKVDLFLEQQIKPNVGLSDWERLERRALSQVPITFTMFHSNILTWFSPYLSLTETGSNIALACGPSSPIADSLMQDVDDMWRVSDGPHGPRAAE